MKKVNYSVYVQPLGTYNGSMEVRDDATDEDILANVENAVGIFIDYEIEE